MPLTVIKSFAEKTGKTESEVESYWKEAKLIVDKEYDKKTESEKYYGTVMNIFKNKLKKHAGLKESRFEAFLTQGTINENEVEIDFVKDFLEQGRAKEKGITREDVDPEQLKMGVEVEMEHTSNPVISERIALDHLAEIKDYYTRLKKMEEESGVKD